jgi:GNAT superfamily N-acetyltransferase
VTRARSDLTIRALVPYSERAFTFRAYNPHRRDVGHISVRRSSKHPMLWIVRDIEVDRDLDREGVGTALWEVAAAEADRRGGRLASTLRVSQAAVDFWQKQIDKGRATVIEEHGYGEDLIALKPHVRNLKNNPPRWTTERHREHLQAVLWDAMSEPLGLRLAKRIAEETVEILSDPDESSTATGVVRRLLARRGLRIDREQIEDAIAAVAALSATR